MPELRNIRPLDAVRAFERAGGERRQGKGSHANVKMPNGFVVTIPTNKSPVKVGVLLDMIKGAELTPDEFVGFLR